MVVYTVKKLAKLSGVSVRTLHFYDEVGLLKPTYYGANGYRYYEEKELLLLQQILFFRELGVELKKIQKVLGRSDFDQLAALHSHRRVLEKELERTQQLLQTIDNTIEHLKGSKKMKDKELFNGLVVLVKPGKGDEPYYLAESLVMSHLKPQTPVEDRDKDFYEKIDKTGKGIYKKIAESMESGLLPASEEVQRLIKKHHTYTEQFHNATKAVYIALAELYEGHPDFRKQLDPIHPKLSKYLAEGMRIFAQKELE